MFLKCDLWFYFFFSVFSISFIIALYSWIMIYSFRIEGQMSYIMREKRSRACNCHFLKVNSLHFPATLPQNLFLIQQMIPDFIFTFVFSKPTDIDECAMDSFICGDYGLCVNTVGAYTCDCIDGYSRVGDSCVGK